MCLELLSEGAMDPSFDFLVSARSQNEGPNQVTTPFPNMRNNRCPIFSANVSNLGSGRIVNMFSK